MSAHTRGPWWVAVEPTETGTRRVIHGPANAVCSGVDEADGNRIVACVNACAGINPDGVPLLFAACERVMQFAVSAKGDEVFKQVQDAIDTATRTVQS